MKLRTIAMGALGIGVSGVGLLFAFWRVHLDGGFHVEPRVHIGEVKAAMTQVRPLWLLLFTGLNVTTLVLRSFQTQALVRRRDGTAPRWSACWQAVTRGRLAEAALSTLCIPIALAGTYGSALYAFGLEGLPAGTTLVLVAAILFAIAIPSAPSSVGVFHAVATWTLTALGAPPATAAAFALVTHAIGVVSFIGLGAVALSELGGRAALREPRV